FADATGDGRPDAISVVPTAANGFDITVLVNDGRGGLSRPIHTRTLLTGREHDSGVASVTADFNGDGRLDLAVGGDEVRLFAGRGDGTFEDPVISKANAYALAAADVTGDGRIDLLAIYGDGWAVHPNAGGGRFEAGVRNSASRNSNGHALIDVDLDGDLDIVLAADVVLIGSGDGRFTHTGAAASDLRETIVGAGDFDEDGYPDLLTQDFYAFPHTLQLHRGTGGRTFAAPIATRIDHRLGAANETIAKSLVADVDGDGHLDLVNNASAPHPGAVTILLGDGRGDFRAGQTVPLSVLPAGIALADLDDNGTLDIGVTEGNSGRLNVLMTGQPARGLRADVLLSGPEEEVRHGEPRTYTIQVSSATPYVARGMVMLDLDGRTHAITHTDNSGKGR
ncbi:MAG TPA: VCBS repeat-containing protein, partial [Thermoanaerobaculia bacterium]